MSLSISPQMRIVAAVAGVLFLGVAAFALGLFNPAPTGTPVPRTIHRLHPGRSLVHHAHLAASASRPATRLGHLAHRQRGVRTHAAARPAHRILSAQPAGRLLAGLPRAVAAALERHAVVVVSLYNPQSQVDGIDVAEAQAGAAVAGAGYVAASMLDQAQASALTKQLGPLVDPELLVYKRPGIVTEQMTGFVDRATVAEAAREALLPPGAA